MSVSNASHEINTLWIGVASPEAQAQNSSSSCVPVSPPPLIKHSPAVGHGHSFTVTMTAKYLSLSCYYHFGIAVRLIFRPFAAAVAR